MFLIPAVDDPFEPPDIEETDDQVVPDLAGAASVAVTESCTGGLLAMRIVETPGSGDWFKGGLVAYAAQVKYRLLGVPEGPVITREAAIEMARGVRDLIGTDVGVATTGVAGPDPEEDQPVGTVYVGVSTKEATQAVLLTLRGSPAEIRRAATDHALQQVFHAREITRQAGSGPRPQRYELAVPEGGFTVVSPYRLEDVSIVGSDVAFTVVAQELQPVTIELVGLDGGPSPAVLLSETGADPMTPGRLGPSGRRLFDVAPGSPLGITWNVGRPTLTD